MNYVYIGAEKTSTTYLQRLFRANRDVLQDSTGITYLAARNFAKELVSAAVAGQDYPLPDTVSPAADRNLIISEFLYRDLTTPDNIAGLQRILDSFLPEYHLVLYVRNQVEWIESYYSTYIKRGKTLSFDRYLNFIMARKKSLDYAAQAEMWEAVFGDRLSVYQYSGQSVLDDVVGRFGCSLEGVEIVDPGSANSSLPPQSLELLRKINIAINNTLSRADATRLQWLLSRAVIANPVGHGKLRANAEQRARIEAYYATCNNALNTRWGTTLTGAQMA